MESSLEINPDKVCRTCMAESANMRPLFHFAGDGRQTLSEDLSFVTNMLIKQEDKLPKQMCNDCEVILHQSSMFKRRCIDSEARFLRLLNTVNMEEIDTDITEKPLAKLDNCNETRSSNRGQPYQCSICIFKFSDIHKLESHIKNMHYKQEKEGSLTDGTFFSDSKHCADTFRRPTTVAKDSEQCTKEEIEYESMEFVEDDSSSESVDNFEECVDNRHHLSKSNLKEATDSPVKPSAVETRRHNIKNNLRRNSETETYVCEHCNLVLKTKSNLQNHLIRKHNKGPEEEREVEKRYECPVCMCKFAYKCFLEVHMKRHEKPTVTAYICAACKRDFKRQRHLDNHIILVHSTENGLKCDYCPNSFATQESLDQHQTMHQNERKHICEFCSKAFSELSALYGHLRVHTDERKAAKTFSCTHCSKRFTHKGNMIAHVRRHEGIKLFRCDHCESSFVTKAKLAIHVHKHTGANPFVCEDCGGSFTASSSLVNHRRTHTGERPYVCDQCPMTFAVSGTLNNHRRTHTGEKPYSCPFCDRTFAQLSYLVAHKRTHTDERPYKCSVCGQRFRNYYALKKHLKLHTDKPEYIPKHLGLQGGEKEGSLEKKQLAPKKQTISKTRLGNK